MRRVVPIIALGGAGVGLGMAALIRRLTRRKSRVERLRDRAQEVARAARARATDAAELRENVDPRAATGGGLLLLLAWGMAEALRRRAERRRARVAEEAMLAATTSAAASRLGLARLGRAWRRSRVRDATKQIEDMVQTTRERRSLRRRRWLGLGGGLALAAALAVAARRRTGAQLDWTGANVSDTAPARDNTMRS